MEFYILADEAIQKAERYGHKAFTRVVRGKEEFIKQKGTKSLKPENVKSQAPPVDPVRAKHESKEIVRGMGYAMKVFKQSQEMCGPASVRIALSGVTNKKYSEKQIAQLANSTAAEGTTHKDLIKAIKKLGVHTTTYQNLSKSHAVEILKNYSAMGNPIIVDWMKTKLQRGGDAKASEGMKPGKEEAKDKKDIEKEENEHFSVVQRVDDKSVYLLDPLERKVERLPINYFVDRWLTKSENVSRWFTVLEK